MLIEVNDDVPAVVRLVAKGQSVPPRVCVCLLSRSKRLIVLCESVGVSESVLCGEIALCLYHIVFL